MNKVVLIGRLTKDPELKFTPGNGTAVATLTLAINRKVKNASGQYEADFIPIVVWGKQAEATANYMRKGRLMSVSGRIQTRSYDAKDGTKRFVTEVVADEVQFLDKGNSSNQNNNASNNNNNDSIYEDEMTPIDDNDIPF